MTPNGLERGRLDAMGASQPVEVGAEPRAFLHPASDAKIRVVALGKDPAVAAGHDPELDPRGLLVRRPLERAPRHVAFERDTADDAFAEPDCAGDDTVGPVGADDERRTDDLVADARRHTGVVELDLADGDAVTKVGSLASRLLGEVEVEPPALGHPDQRRRARAADLGAVADTHDHPVDDVLDDGLDVARSVPERAPREPAAARLVAWEARLVGEQHARARTREVDRSRRAGRARTHDEGVELLHPTIVGRSCGHGYNCPPRRGSRVAKGGGL